MKRLRPFLASILKKWACILTRENVTSENGEPARNRNESNQEARQDAPVTRTILEVPHAILDEYHRTQKEQETDNRKNRHIALGALIVAAILAGIGLWQSCLTN